MLSNKGNSFASEYQLQLCIERVLPQSVQVISENLQEYCTQLIRKHQLNLSYTNEELSSDLLLLFTKVSSYSEIVQSLLCGFTPYKKIGKVIESLNITFDKIFRFLKIHMKQKKDYTEQRLQYFQSKFESQAPGRCNRCLKFVLSRNIEETKILLTAGQFNDPFDLYDMGSSDFVNIRNKEDDQDYRLKFAEVWENKKKVEQKFHMMQLQFDKRAYGFNYSVGEIQKIQDIIQVIALEISNNENLNLNTGHKNFEKSVSQLVCNIYKKLCDFKLNQNCKEIGVQVDEVVSSFMIEEMKQINQKATQKSKDLSRKLTIKQRQLTDLGKKIQKIQQQHSLCIVQKSSYESAIKNLMNKQVQYEKQIYNESSNSKGYLKKVQQLQKQNENLKNQIKKIYDHLETRKIQKKKAIKSVLKSSKSINSKRYISKPKIDTNVENQPIEKGSLPKQNKRISVILRSLNKSSSQQSQISQEDSQKKIQYVAGDTKTSKKHIQFNISPKDKKEMKDVVEFNGQTSLSAHRLPTGENNQSTDPVQHTQISIQIKNTEKNLQLFRSTSTSRIKNGVISLKRIKKKPSLIKNLNQLDNIVKQPQLPQNNKVEIAQEAKESEQIIRKSIKSKSGKVHFKSKFQKNSGNLLQKNKISERKSESGHQNSSTSLNKSRKVSHKFHSVYTSKTSIKAQQEGLNKNKDSIKFQKISKTPKKKPLHHANISNPGKNQIKTHDIRSGNNQKVLNRSQQDSMLSTLPNIFNTEKLEKMKIDKEDKQNQEPYLSLYTYYKKLIDQFNTKNLSENKKANQFDYFRKCVDNFIKFMAKQINSSSKAFCMPQMIPQVSLQKMQANRTANKHQSLHSTSTQNLSGSSTRQWKNKLEYWKWAGGDTIKSKWARRQVNMSSLNNTYNCTENKQNQLTTMQITQIKTKIGKLYFSFEEAYQLQKSHPISMAASFNFTHNSLKSPNLPTKPPAQIMSILSKHEIKYLKLITILLAKLHDKNIQVYETVKKSIMFPYSYLTDDFVMASFQTKKVKKQRKTVGAHPLLQQSQNSTFNLNDCTLISQSIIKLIFLHRKCNKVRHQLPKAQISNKNQQTNIHSNIYKTSTSFYQKSLCKHLREFQQQIQRQFGSRAIRQEKQDKLQKFNNTDMAKHQC